MKQLTAVVCLLIATSLAAQVYRPASQTITTSGTTAVMPNLYGGFNATFEEIPSGAPATVSITVQGCMTAGTCDTAADTNTTTSATIRGVAFTKVYSYFLVTASWTGGSSPTVTVNSVISTARSSTGGGGSGTVTSVGLTLPAVFTVSGSPVTTTGSLTAAFASIGAHLYLGNNTAGSATAALVRPVCGDLSDSGTACTSVAPANNAGATHFFFTAYNSTTGAFSTAQPACADLSTAGTGCSATLATVATTGSAADLSGTLSNARLPGAISVTTLTASGAVTGSSFVGTAAGGVGNNWLAAEGTDPGTEATGQDLCWGDSAAHRVKCSFNNGTAAQLVKSGADINTSDQITGINGAAFSGTNGDLVSFGAANIPADSGFLATNAVRKDVANTGGASMTLDLHSTPVTTGLRLPNGAGAAPTIDGQLAQDTTTHTLVCGNGTTTTHCMVEALISGCGNTGVTNTGGTTSFVKITGGVACANNSESTVRQMLPYAGTVTNLCVTTTGAQSGTGSLVITFRDTTSGTDSALTTTIATSQGATAFQCDTTHSATIVAGHDYSLEFKNNASATAATTAGLSASYNY